MTEIIKAIIVAGITIIGVWITLATDVKDHERRIDHLEKWSEDHEDRSRVVFDKIDNRLSRIEIALGIGRMSENQTVIKPQSFGSDIRSMK